MLPVPLIALIICCPLGSFITSVFGATKETVVGPLGVALTGGLYKLLTIKTVYNSVFVIKKVLLFLVVQEFVCFVQEFV